MVNHGEIQGAIIRDLQNFKNVAYGIIVTFVVASFAIYSSIARASMLLPSSGVDLCTYIGKLVRLLVVMVLILRWVAGSTSELSFCIAHLHIATPRWQMYFAMCVLAGALGLMAVFAVMPLEWFAGYMCGYALVDRWVYKVFIREYMRSRHLTMPDNPQHDAILQALDEFWYRPHVGRVDVMLAVSAVSFALSLVALLFQPPWRIVTRILATTVLLVTLLLAEYILSRWQTSQDDAIDRATLPVRSDSTSVSATLHAS